LGVSGDGKMVRANGNGRRREKVKGIRDSDRGGRK